ncbi:hypothetical protein K488DRAFT_67103 [Vararia minispora EC-137]|uniref:Uncharacterized protein n=1 Tax=Vararia minispora EC-137 TaxID=1314806 RepID=A0ACB8QZW8_9AGAM|nr:hypothetical protein K488DRAFT_67103 [Vararia minispora EC-137]
MAADHPDLDDILGHSRIHDWIAEQYSFALTDDQDAYPPPSLRESCVLPPDFNPHASPPLVHRPEDDCADEHEYLVQEMNSWRVSSTRNKPLPSPPSRARGLSDEARSSSSSSSPPSSPRAVSARTVRSLPASPSPARKRPSLPLLSTVHGQAAFEPDLDEDEHQMLTSSASYVSLRTRVSQLPPSPSSRHRPERYPSISTRLSNLPPVPPTPTTVAHSPTTPTMHTRTPSTPHLATPPLTNSSSLSSTPSQIYLPSLTSQPSMPSLTSRPSSVSLRNRPSIPEIQTPVDEVIIPIARPHPFPRREGSHSGYLQPRHPAAEKSRWSVATSTDGDPATPPVPSTPSKPKSFRTRLLSTISRLSKKPSSPHLAAHPPTPSRHERNASQASSAELGYLSDIHDADDPFARPPPIPTNTDYADFLSRSSRPHDLPDLDPDASYITNDASYLTNTVSYMSGMSSLTFASAPPTTTEFAEPADRTLLRAAEREKDRKRNRMSWASTKSVARARAARKRLLVTGLAYVPNAKLGDIKPETLNAQEQAIYAWCEGFGEIRRTARAAGALALEWRAGGVAESVCAAQTRAHIPGAGDVVLSLVESRRKLF